MKWVIRCGCLGALLNGLYFSFWEVTNNSLVAFLISLVAISLIVFLYRKKLNLDFRRFFQLSLGIGTAYIIVAWVLITIFPPTVIRDIGDIIYPYQQSLMYGLITIAVIPIINLVRFKKNV